VSVASVEDLMDYRSEEYLDSLRGHVAVITEVPILLATSAE
jgi:hypothetical protein